MTKSNQPISSFGAEIQSALRAGAEREIRLKFDHQRLAVRFGQRINALRAAMKREGHPDWTQLYRCGVHHDPTDPRILIIAPKDSEFRSALQAAGVEVSAPLPISEFDIRTPEPGAPLSDADSFLATLTEVTTVPKSELTPEQEQEAVEKLKEL